MNNIEKEIYESIKNGYYEILDKNRQNITQLIPSSLKCKTDEDIFTDSLVYDDVKEARDLREKLINSLMRKFCNSDKDIKFVSDISSSKIIYFRGVEIPKQSYLKNLSSRIYAFHRNGVYGKGQYFTLDINYALCYANRNSENVLTATFDEDSKEIRIEDLNDLIKDFLKEVNDPNNNCDPKVVSFINREQSSAYIKSIIAGSHGYDVIYDPFGIQSSVYCVINPEKVSYLSNEK